MCCAYGTVNAAHVQAALMCRTCSSYCRTSICSACMLLVYAACAACTHACYRYTTQVFLALCMLLQCCVHPTCHICKLLVFLIMCSLHTCILLQCCIHAASHIMIFINVAVLLISECQLHCFIQQDLFQELILSFHVCCIHKY